MISCQFLWLAQACLTFLSSSSQLEYRCKTKWRFEKNLDRATWQQIGSVVGRQNVKKNEVFWKGQPLKPGRVTKETRRHLPLRCRPTSGQLARSTSMSQWSFSSVVHLLTRDLEEGLALRQQCKPLWYHTSSQQAQVAKRQPTFYNLRSSFFHGRISDADFSIILHYFANNLIEDVYELRLRDVIDWSYNLVQGLKAADLRTGTESAIFQAATNRLWTLIFSNEAKFNTFGYVSEEDDSRLLAVVSWLLATDPESYLSEGSLAMALAYTLCSGHVLTACLLWRRMTPNQRSRSSCIPRTLRRTASGRSKTATLLFRDMLSQNAWPVLCAVSQYGDMDMFSTLLPDMVRLIAKETRQAGHPTTPREAIALIVAGCARAEPEHMALSKLRAAEHFLLFNPIPLSEDVVNADAFMAATARGYSELFDNLVKVNGNPCIRDRRGFSALQVAAEFGEVKLLNQMLLGSPPGYHDKDLYILTMHVGLLSGQLDVLQVLCQHMQTLFTDIIKPEQWREMLCSCQQQHTCYTQECELPPSRTGLFEYFISRYQLVELEPWIVEVHCVACVLCFTALRACNDGLVQLLDFCLQHGADPDWKLPCKPLLQTPSSPLDAALNGSFRGFGHVFIDPFPSALPEDGIEVPRRWRDVFSSSGGGVLERMECARLLFQQGVLPTDRHLEISLFAGEWEMAQLVLEQGVLPSMRDLESAICGQSAACVQNMASLLDKNYHAESLCAAVFFSSECSTFRQIALDLIARRDNRTPGTEVESAAIGLAAMLNDTELLCKLLDAIRDPSQLCISPGAWSHSLRESPDGDEKMREHMIKGIRPGYPFWRSDTAGRISPLAFAVLKYSCEGVSIMMRHGLKPDIPTCTVAVLRRRSDILRLLLIGQPELHLWAHHEYFLKLPLVGAVQRDDYAMVGQLLSAGADINGSEGDGTRLDNPLQAAAAAGNLDMTRFLLNQGAQVDREPGLLSSGTALSLAVANGHVDVAKLLIERGADINGLPISESRGQTCMEAAAQNGRFEMIQLLIENGLRTSNEHRGRYLHALVLARWNDHYVLAQHLRSYGGWTMGDDIAAKMMYGALFGKEEKWLSKREIAEIEVEATLEQARNDASEGSAAEAPALHRLGGGETNEGLLAHGSTASHPQSFAISPWSLMGGGIWPRSPQETVFLTPPPCPDDDDGEWIQDWGPLFMRTPRGQDGVGDEVENLD